MWALASGITKLRPIIYIKDRKPAVTRYGRKSLRKLTPAFRTLIISELLAIRPVKKITEIRVSMGHKKPRMKIRKEGK
jgi:hypothetical protein